MQMFFFTGNYDVNFTKNHNIKKIIVTNVIEGIQSSSGCFIFNKNGVLLTGLTYDSSGQTTGKFTFKLNKYGDPVQRIHDDFVYHFIDTVHFMKEFEGGQMISEKSSLFPLITYFTYNTNGQRITAKSVNSTDTSQTPLQFLSFNYDSTGKLSTIEENRKQEDDTI